MSALTKDNLDAAIAAHFADLWDGGMITGYVLQMAGFTEDDIDNGDTSYSRTVADKQASHITLGLLDYCHAALRHDMITGARDE